MGSAIRVLKFNFCIDSWEFHIMHPNSDHLLIPSYHLLTPAVLPKKKSKQSKQTNENKDKTNKKPKLKQQQQQNRT